MSGLTDPDCIFCGDEPCVTHAAQKKSRKKTKPSGFVVPAQTPTSSTSLSPDTSSDLFVGSDARENKFTARAESVSILSEDELIDREAIRNLAPLLSRSAREEFRDYLDPPKGARLSRQGAELRRALNGWDS